MYDRKITIGLFTLKSMKIRQIIQLNKGRCANGSIDRLRSNHLIGGYSIEYF